MPYAQVNGSKIYFLDEGSGPPLFFVHGLGGNHHMFNPQIRYFQKTHRVIAADLRGNGRSGKLTGPIHSILDRQCDDLAKLMEHLNFEKVFFCGTSYGGMLCLHFGLRYPNRVVGMVIADAFSDIKVEGLTDGMINSINFLTLWTSYLPKFWIMPLLYWRYRRWPLAKQHALEVAKHIRKHELVLQRLYLLGVDFTKYLPQIRYPILGIVGDNVPASIRHMKQAMKLIPGAKLEIVEDSFDPTNLCQVNCYNTLVEKFLSQLKW